jgi:hypothetical protein
LLHAGTNPYSFVEESDQADNYLKDFMQRMEIVQINNYATRQGFIHYEDGRMQSIGCELPLNAKVTLDNNIYTFESFNFNQQQAEFNNGLKGYLIKCVVNSV